MADSQRVLAQAEAMLRRVSPEGRRMTARARQRRFQAFLRKLMRAALAMLLVALGTAAFGLLIAPIGIEGLLLSFVLMAVAAGAILFWPSRIVPTPQELAASDLPLLPQRTEAWLERQRPALPAPAARLVDGIGLRLEALAPQLQTLDPREPAAAGIRKLMAEELPELIDGYRRVPQELRRQDRSGGASPDKQLIDGLNAVDTQLADITAQLASGDLHRLAVQSRYLESKYKGDAQP